MGHISTHSSAFLKSTRETRKDVYIRKMLRAIKKFFLMLFKHHNNKLINKRLSKVSSLQILQALKDLSMVYVTPHNSYEMGKFMFKFLSLNSLDPLKSDCEAIRAGTSIHECSQSYNDAKFEGLISSEYFRTLVTSFINLRAQSVETLEGMSSAQTWKNQSKSKGSNFTGLIEAHLKANMGEGVEAWLEETHKIKKQTLMEDLQEYLSHFKKSPKQENEKSSNLTKRALGNNRLKSHNPAKDKIMKRMKNELEVRSSHHSLEKFSLTPKNRLLNAKLKRKKKYGLSDSRKAKSSYNNKPVLISNGLIAVSNKIEGKHPKKKFFKKDKGIKMSYSPINQNHDFDNDYLEQDMKNLDEPNKEPPITLLPLSFSPNSSAFLKFRKV